MGADVQMDQPALEAFLRDVFPQAAAAGFVLERVQEDCVRLSWVCGDAQLRPGGTVSGPTLFTLADVASYLLVLAHNGPIALAVTTSLNLSFLSKAGPGLVWCEARPLRLGWRLAVIDVRLGQGDELVAAATVTYAIPRQ